MISCAGAGASDLSSGLGLLVMVVFAGGDAIAAEPNVVTLETFIRHGPSCPCPKGNPIRAGLKEA